MNQDKMTNHKFHINKTTIAAIVLVAVAGILYLMKLPGDTDTKQEVVKDSDMVISLAEVTQEASFYPAEMNGIKLEVLAVKAPDGTVRTAFNTCQVCFSSGRGYYIQEGDELVCQNCGNRFGMDDVEVTRGGCNPVPISSEYKTVDRENITISKDFLTQATVIFENWK